MARWEKTPVAVAFGGEAVDPAPGLLGTRLRLLRNGLITGPARIQQAPDFREVAVCENSGPSEVHAVCGIFPFTKQGGASAASAGLAFSHDADANAILLHQIGEDRTILRTFTAWAGYAEALPPQITGFEMFGKFYFCEYAGETVANRQGFSVFDPTGAGSITVPTFDLVSGGAAAAALRFRGIAKHRGATILGWGYLSEETASIDQPQAVRYCKYGEPDTWVADTLDTSAGFFNLGTLDLPVIGAAQSGLYTVIAKEAEIFALDGDYGAQFYTRQIGEAHGPASTVGMVSFPGGAIWLSKAGPVASVNGGQIQLVGIDRIVGRFLNYVDLATAWGDYDSARHRVVWALRRSQDENGDPEDSPYLTELLIWDHARNEFYVTGVPAPIFCVGRLRGAGIELVGPTGVVSAITPLAVYATVALIGWTPGDATTEVTFEVEYRATGATGWTPAGTTAATELLLVSLSEATHYDVRVRQWRNGQESAWTTELDLFNTIVGPNIIDPTNAAIAETDRFYNYGLKLYWELRATWDSYVGPNTEVVLYRSNSNVFATAVAVARADPAIGEVHDPTYQLQGATIYYWLRQEAIGDPGVTSNEVQCSPFPITVSGRL